MWIQQYASWLRNCKSQDTQDLHRESHPGARALPRQGKGIFTLPSSWLNTLTHTKRQIQILRKNAAFSLVTISQWVKWPFDFNLGACFSPLFWETQKFSFNNSILKIVIFSNILDPNSMLSEVLIPFPNYGNWQIFDGQIYFCSGHC